MLPSSVVIEEYVDASGFSAFGDWFGALAPVAAAKVTVAITRIARGAVSNVKGVGDGPVDRPLPALEVGQPHCHGVQYTYCRA